MWGVPETLLLQECCECPEAHTLKCRGREPAGWLPRALRDLPGGTSLDELARVRLGLGQRLAQQRHYRWKAQRAQRDRYT